MQFHRVNGRHLRALRELRGWSLTALAKAVDLSPTHLSRVERGERDMSAATATRIATLLGIPVSVILSEREETVA